MIEGSPVNKPGIISPEDGANLRDAPRPGDESTVESHLPFGTRVFVGREIPGGWYEVTHVDGRQGYVAATRVKIDLPEPGAKLHRVGSSESAIGIAEGEYRQLVRPGQDLRFYVNVLEYVNRGEGDRGIFRKSGDDWKDTRTRAGYLIWLPSPTFAQSLEGIVDDGSITNGAWARAKEVASDVADFALGVGGAVAGLLHGAVESLVDILVGLADLVGLAWDVLKSVFTGSIVADIQKLWTALSELDWKELVSGWISGFEAKWNHEDVFEKWHFRGWVVGYVLMEVALTLLSFGVISGAKWVGKASKAAKAIAALPRVQAVLKPIKSLKNVPDELLKALKGAKVNKLYDSLLEGLGDEARRVLAALPDDEIAKVSELYQRSPDAVTDLLETYAIKHKGGDGPDVPRYLDDALTGHKAVVDRGYPHGFADLEKFQQFKKSVTEALDAFDLPSGDVRVHGSSVLRKNPGDIDVAVMVDEATFSRIIGELSGGTDKTRIIKEIGKADKKGKISQFLFPRLEGLPSFGQTVHGVGGAMKVQISIIKKGGGFDLGPYLNF